jgi:hypothetical protein
MKEKKIYHSRISDKILNNTESLEELFGLFNNDNLLDNYNYFKEYLSKELPHLTHDDILKFDYFFSKIKEIYEWHNIHEFMAGIEFEERK